MMIWWQGYNDLYTALRTPSHHVGLRSSLSTSHHHHDTVFPRSRQNCRVMRDDLNRHTFSTVADIPPILSVIIKCLSLNSQARTQSAEERSLIISAVALMTDRNLYWTFRSGSQSEMGDISKQIMKELGENLHTRHFTPADPSGRKVELFNFQIDEITRAQQVTLSILTLFHKDQIYIQPHIFQFSR